MRNNIYIGTSGYVFSDWRGIFYPNDLKKNEFLKFYSNTFATVELNFSYYAMPQTENLQKMELQTPENFIFFIKAHKTMTHFKINGSSFKKVMEDSQKFSQTVANYNKIKGILFQFPYSFKYNRENLSIIEKIFKLIKNDIIVEFRHKSWLNYSVSDVLKRLGVTYCCVDEPNLPGLLPPIVRNFGKFSYIRFHGRNSQRWWSKDPNSGKLRYDYLYTDAQLREWKDKIEFLSDESENVYIFFNNCHMGKAVKNAKTMQNILRNL